MVTQMFKKTNPPQKNLDQVVIDRLLADDFAQPQVQAISFYKDKAHAQIGSAIKAILNATNQQDFSIAIAQALAFVNAAHDFEFIDLSEKSAWIVEINCATKTQLVEEYA